MHGRSGQQTKEKWSNALSVNLQAMAGAARGACGAANSADRTSGLADIQGGVSTHQRPAQAGADYDNFRHGCPPVERASPVGSGVIVALDNTL